MGGMGGGMGGMGGGMMRIAPERRQKLEVTIVCLEHGRPDPNPRMAYRMMPLERFTNDGRVAAVCEALGRGQLTQKTAQAAAWHLTDGLTWEELANKNSVESRYTGNVRWFSPMDLRLAMAAVAHSEKIAAGSTGETAYAPEALPSSD